MVDPLETAAKEPIHPKSHDFLARRNHMFRLAQRIASRVVREPKLGFRTSAAWIVGKPSTTPEQVSSEFQARSSSTAAAHVASERVPDMNSTAKGLGTPTRADFSQFVHPQTATTGAERTHTIAEVVHLPPGTPVRLSGWVERHRLLGGLLFMTLRDYTGSVQCAWSEEEAIQDEKEWESKADTCGSEGFARASKVSLESVVSVYGYVRPRPEAMVRADQGARGNVEIRITSLRILNPALPLPVNFQDAPSSGSGAGAAQSTRQKSDEDALLRYRFLELRLPEMQRILRTRAALTLAARNELYGQGFIEVETPLLVKSTPEGAREFLVPARTPGRFYALPQSPQQHKQLLMASGVDKYFQIARCFRDESGRQDRQPEFTQIDMEMSFVGQDEVMRTLEKLFLTLYRAARKNNNELPATAIASEDNDSAHISFPRMSFRDAMNFYGSDKPDIRYGLEIQDITNDLRELYKESGLDTDPLIQTCLGIDADFLNQTSEDRDICYPSTLARDVQPCIKALHVPGLKLVKPKSGSKAKGGETLAVESMKHLLELIQTEAKLGGSPAGTLAIETGKWKLPGSMKLLNLEGGRQRLVDKLCGDSTNRSGMIFIIAGNWLQTCTSLGRIRSLLGKLCMEGVIEIDGQCGFTGDKVRDSATSFFKNKFLQKFGMQSPLLGWHSTQGVPPSPTFHWVIDFPLFEIEDINSLIIHSSHHPFTAPHPEDITKLLDVSSAIAEARKNAGNSPVAVDHDLYLVIARLAQVRALHYDLVSNGLEVGGGSIRVHSKDLQEAVFKLLDVTNDKFDHLLHALSLGCPPHGGFAAGLDRVTAILASTGPNPLRLRDVIAFPKTLTGKDLMLDAPAYVTQAQLDEYYIRTKESQ